MSTEEMIFPGKTWIKGDPEEFGFTKKALQDMDENMKQAEANGALILNGRFLVEWNYAGPSERTVEIQSCTKSITSMMLGLAVQDGLIPNIDAFVKDYWPDFENGPYTDKITFRHLATMTSGISSGGAFVAQLSYFDPGNMEPGKEHHYTNSQSNALAAALTYLYERTLSDVIKEKVLSALEIEDKFRWWVGKMAPIQGYSIEKIVTAKGEEVPVNIGAWGTQWSARDLARIGLLYLNKGMWKDKRVLAEEFVKESLTDIPFEVKEWRLGKWFENQPRTQKYLMNVGYGLSWWTTRGAETEVWNMGGNGGQFCLLIPEYGVVMTKINGYAKRPFIAKNAFVPTILDCLR
jgi:CubicO group peptidase (beta-lactamase class C family)